MHYSWLHLLLDNIRNKYRNHMEDPSITGLVASWKSPFKLSIIFNILPCVSVDTWMTQQGLIYLISDTAWNISCTIHMNLSYNQERKKRNGTSMFLQSRGCRNQQKPGILQLLPYILLWISRKIYIWQTLGHIKS